VSRITKIRTPENYSEKSMKPTQKEVLDNLKEAITKLNKALIDVRALGMTANLTFPQYDEECGLQRLKIKVSKRETVLEL